MSKSFSIVYHYIPEFYYLRLASHYAHINHYKTLENRKGFYLFGGTEYPHNSGYIFVHGFEDAAQVEEFVKIDPFVSSGLVNSYFIEQIEPIGKKNIDEVAKYYAYVCK